MKKSKYLMTVLGLTILASGCSNNEKQSSNNTQNQQNTQVQQVNSEVDLDNKKRPAELACCPKPDNGVVVAKSMTAAELVAIENDKKEKDRYLLIDTRSEDEYNKGHLKYAINMPANMLKEKIGRIRDWEKVILYGNTESELKELTDALIADGFVYVYTAPGVKEYNYNYVKYKNLTGSEFQKILNKQSEFFIDSRDQKDYNKVHPKDSINVDYTNLSDLESKLPTYKSKALYLYDYTGDRSVTVAEKLQELGYNNITISIEGTKETQFKF